MKGLVCVNVCACHVKVMSNVKAPESKKNTVPCSKVGPLHMTLSVGFVATGMT